MSAGSVGGLRPAGSVALTRAEADALLYVLDDADRLFMHHHGERVLAMWQRLNRACCYLDGVGGFHGTPAERELAIHAAEALALRWTLDAAWLRTVRPKALRQTVAAVVARCAERAS